MQPRSSIISIMPVCSKADSTSKGPKLWLQVLAACMVISCAACSTIITRLTGPDWRPPDHPLPRIYSGTLFDFRCLFRSEMYDTQGLGGFCLIDVPFSLVVDTVILPYTIYDQIKYGSYATSKPADEKKAGEIKSDSTHTDDKKADEKKADDKQTTENQIKQTPAEKKPATQ
jgi:uncharacterized protein YceK